MAEERGAKVDVGKSQLGQGGVDEVHAFEQGRTLVGARARSGDLKVIGLALGDVGR